MTAGGSTAASTCGAGGLGSDGAGALRSNKEARHGKGTSTSGEATRAKITGLFSSSAYLSLSFLLVIGRGGSRACGGATCSADGTGAGGSGLEVTGRKVLTTIVG